MTRRTGPQLGVVFGWVELSATSWSKEDRRGVHSMELLESVLAHVSLFQELRPDELGQVAGRFSIVRLQAGDERSFSSSTSEARLVVVIEGEIDLFVDTAMGKLR